jgi:hypothetical protein
VTSVSSFTAAIAAICASTVVHDRARFADSRASQMAASRSKASTGNPLPRRCDRKSVSASLRGPSGSASTPRIKAAMTGAASAQSDCRCANSVNTRRLPERRVSSASTGRSRR